MNYKKIISTILVILLTGFTSLTYAGNYKSSSYKDVIQKDEFNLAINLNSSGNVELKWNKINTSGDFKYYKLVRSNNNPNPKYPEDGYIKYSSDINFTNYIDYKPKKGVNYYRICKIMKDNNRYCSKTQKIYIENGNNKTEKKYGEYKKVNYRVRSGPKSGLQHGPHQSGDQKTW